MLRLLGLKRKKSVLISANVNQHTDLPEVALNIASFIAQLEHYTGKSDIDVQVGVNPYGAGGGELTPAIGFAVPSGDDYEIYEEEGEENRTRHVNKRQAL